MGSTGRDVHIDKPLSNVAIAYEPKGFMSDQIAPIVPVGKQSDGYYVWSPADAFRRERSDRAPGTEANVITRSVTSDTYFARNYALKDRIPYEDIKNADDGYVFAERSSRARFIKSKLMLDMELRVANLVTSTSNVGSSSVVASAWTATTGNADAIGDINNGINVVEDTTGYRPNKLIFGGYAWRTFRNNADVLSRFFGSAGPGSPARLVTKEMTANLFEVDQVLVSGGYYSTADEGQSASLSNIWFDSVLAAFIPLRPSKEEPSFMYSFRWNAVKGFNMQAQVFDLPRAHSEEVELGYYQAEKITASTLGFLVTGVGSAQ